MLSCFTFYVVFVISLLITSFSAFSLSPPLRRWMDRTETLTVSTLRELASLSDKEALEAFGHYLIGAAALSFLAAFALQSVTSEGFHQVAVLLGCVFFYSAASIGAWSKNRDEITKKFIEETKRDSGRAVKYYSLFSAVAILIAVTGAIMLGESVVDNFGPMLGYTAVGLALVIGSMVVANSISLLVLFAPAFLAIAYLWLAIFAARGALAVGKRSLVNLFVGYCFVATAYLALLSVPSLRIWLAVPAICQ